VLTFPSVGSAENTYRAGGAQPYLTTGHSDVSDVAKGHKQFLKYNINVLEHRTVFILFIFVSDCGGPVYLSV
jgi:hypothetical protein